MILLIDNYDSFTYNLYQYIGEIYEDIKVVRNDEITIDEIKALAPAAIVISPGPGYPESAGISIDVIKCFYHKIPILGVCLGHQAIGEAFGGRIVRAKELVHGKATVISLNNTAALFKGLPDRLSVARYHSLMINSGSLPDELKVIAQTDADEIMAVAHRQFPVYGVQFHPESIMTKFGKRILYNFVVHIAHLSPKAQEETQSLSAADCNVLKPFIKKVIDSVDLKENEAENAMECMMDGGATDAQIGSFLTGLRMKGETVDEITGFARAMRKKAAAVRSSGAIDIVGTGGDLSNTFNISTTAAFVAAGAGLTVAKHGNRSVSSRSGSADVLEALGIKIDMTPEQAAKCLDCISLAFMFAPSFHKSMKYAASARREIGVRSVFNILGPLANPASAETMLLGVYDEQLMEVMATVLMKLNIKNAIVAHGSDGLDEITTAGSTKLCEVCDGKLIKYEITPEEFGLTRAEKSELVGGTAKENARITLDVLSGKAGAQRDIVVLNTAAAIYAARKASSITEGIVLAMESIDSGAAMGKLNELIAMTNAF